MKLLYLLALLLYLGSCTNDNGSNLQGNEAVLITERRQEISDLDRIFLREQKHSTIYAETSDGKRSKVAGLEGIQGLRFSYHLFHDDSGNVRVAAVVPREIRDDMYAQYLHYFNVEGKTIAFKRSLQYFDLDCSQEMILLSETEYYTTDWNAPETITDLHTESGKVLDPGRCVIPYRENYRVYSDLSDWLKGTGLK